MIEALGLPCKGGGEEGRDYIVCRRAYTTAAGGIAIIGIGYFGIAIVRAYASTTMAPAARGIGPGIGYYLSYWPGILVLEDYIVCREAYIIAESQKISIDQSRNQD